MRKTTTVDIVRGPEGCCLVVNDYRICGPKPWGGGKLVERWVLDAVELVRVLEVVPAEEEKK